MDACKAACVKANATITSQATLKNNLLLPYSLTREAVGACICTLSVTGGLDSSLPEDTDTWFHISDLGKDRVVSFYVVLLDVGKRILQRYDLGVLYKLFINSNNIQRDFYEFLLTNIPFPPLMVSAKRIVAALKSTQDAPIEDARSLQLMCDMYPSSRVKDVLTPLQQAECAMKGIDIERENLLYVFLNANNSMSPIEYYILHGCASWPSGGTLKYGEKSFHAYPLTNTIATGVAKKVSETIYVRGGTDEMVRTFNGKSIPTVLEGEFVSNEDKLAASIMMHTNDTYSLFDLNDRTNEVKVKILSNALSLMTENDLSSLEFNEQYYAYRLQLLAGMSVSVDAYKIFYDLRGYRSRTYVMTYPVGNWSYPLLFNIKTRRFEISPDTFEQYLCREFIDVVMCKALDCNTSLPEQNFPSLPFPIIQKRLLGFHSIFRLTKMPCIFLPSITYQRQYRG